MRFNRLFVFAPYSPYTYVCTCIQLTLEHGPGGRINKYRYTRVASGLPRICCGNSYTADPGTRCGGGRIIKYLTVIQELHAVYPVFVVAPYMLLTLVRGLGGRIIEYFTVIQDLNAVYPVFVVAPYTQLTLVRGVGVVG